ncbi:hypothetical protein ACFYUR_18665 [Micromonospora haikouensis]|uniref:hypothetical protein n=1 Tax=Micromonospora haikouensis TaxID=686309 RepID=UPI00369764CE
MTCATCGTPHNPDKCNGHAKSTGKQCTAWPIKGGRVCIKHGGKAGQVRAAAEKRIQEAEAVKAVVTFGLSREVDPRDALLEEVHRTAGAVAWLHEQVQALRTEDVVWGVTEEVTKDAGEFPGVDTTRAAKVNVWVELWQRERLHLVKVCKEAIGSGLEERRVRLAEQQGAMLAGVIKAILGDLDLTPEQQTTAARVVPFRLRSVASGAAA